MLPACRRRLRSAPDEALTVQEVASQWGFFHMGRFSQEYRAMFGQSPSQTLRDARAVASLDARSALRSRCRPQ